jgi:taurine dioxygenase
MKSVVLEPVGVEVTDVTLREVTTEQAREITELLAEHGVAVFPDQEIDDEQFVAFLRGFGELVFTTGETPVPGCSDLNVITNVGRTTPPRSTFHVDSSYLRVPPAYTALRAVSIPSAGGETLFTNQYAAFASLPADVVATLEGRTMKHVVTGLDLTDEDETEAEHPVFAEHPVSGQTSLYLSTPQRCQAISGMSDGEAAEMVAYLFEHSTKESNTFRHAWAPGDVVMWDNRCVLHKADHGGVVGDRVMHRGMVAG